MWRPCRGPLLWTALLSPLGAVQHVPLNSEFPVTWWFNLPTFSQGGSWAWASVTHGHIPQWVYPLPLPGSLCWHPSCLTDRACLWGPLCALLSQERHFSREWTLLVAPAGLPMHPSPKRADHPPAQAKPLSFCGFAFDTKKLDIYTDASSQSRFQELKLFLIKLALEAIRKFWFLQLACCPSTFPGSTRGSSHTPHTACPTHWSKSQIPATPTVGDKATETKGGNKTAVWQGKQLRALQFNF